MLEWIEKSKTPNDAQKNTRHVPCQVSAHSKDGEPELKADSWPQKLIMQLIPKQLIENIGGAYLKNSKSVLFYPQPCEALESLTRMMCSGFNRQQASEQDGNYGNRLQIRQKDLNFGS
ncbi:Mediator of RNA polymerase II transcription subunit 25 [Homalodisca vitripennis]|nr:Mediator of RNA polymerase II transcription subunit 25 [Homalodisca vitripennis]